MCRILVLVLLVPLTLFAAPPKLHSDSVPLRPRVQELPPIDPPIVGTYITESKQLDPLGKLLLERFKDFDPKDQKELVDVRALLRVIQRGTDSERARATAALTAVYRVKAPFLRLDQVAPLIKQPNRTALDGIERYRLTEERLWTDSADSQNMDTRRALVDKRMKTWLTMGPRFQAAISGTDELSKAAWTAFVGGKINDLPEQFRETMNDPLKRANWFEGKLSELKAERTEEIFEAVGRSPRR